MAAKIKLQRVGTKNKPKYRLIVQEERSKVLGRVVEILGEYNPQLPSPFINFKKETVEKWLKVGAKPTDKVRYIFGKIGIMPPVDTTNLTKRKPKKRKNGETNEPKNEKTEELKNGS